MIKKRILLVLTDGMCVDAEITTSSPLYLFKMMKFIENHEGIQEVRPDVNS